MPDMNNLARWLVLIGLALAAIGGLFWLLTRAGVPLGRLPGDIRIERGNLSCYIPIATSLLLSLVLTLILNLLARLFR
jgi:hypothetical protein